MSCVCSTVWRMRALLTRPSRGRGLAAFACALAALAAAVAAAIGPAVPDQATYSWPPTTIPDKHPTRSWFAPLLLNTRTPHTLTTRIPCSPGLPLPGATKPLVVLATARHPKREHALQITQTNTTTTIRVGTTTLAQLPNTRAPCTATLQFRDSDWTITRAGSAPLQGHLAQAPTVNGLITQLDLHTTTGLHATITPTTQDTHPSRRQTLLRFLAAFLTATALWLAINPRKPHRPKRPHPTLTLPDTAVALTLTAWWIIGPTYFDDGWVRARQANSLHSGGFSVYYEIRAANLPLATWLEWLQHWVVAYSPSLAVQRLPTLAVLVATWALCRSCLAGLNGQPPRRGGPALWSAAAAFCVGAIAFGMTLRPEPFVALLCTAVLACALSFIERPRVGPIAIALLLSGLSVTTHPAGLVAVAPLVLTVPHLVKAVRDGAVKLLPLGAVAVASAAWVILLAFLDSDIAQRREDLATIESSGAHGLAWIGEAIRYKFLANEASGDSALRRLFVGFLVIAAVGVFARRGRGTTVADVIPATSIPLGLILLVPTPSKWPWHFGVLIGICAVAMGVEIERLRANGTQRERRLGTLIIGLAVACVVAWVISRPFAFHGLELQRFRWAIGGSGSSVRLLVVVSLAVLMAGFLIVAVRGRRAAFRSERLVLWSVPLVAVAFVGVTTGLLIADAALSSGWTLPRQVASSLLGRRTCGLADDTSIPVFGSMAALTRAPAIPPGPLGPGSGGPAGTRVFASGVTPKSEKRVSSGWYLAPEDGRAVGFFVSGRPDPRRSVVTVVWGATRQERVIPLASGRAHVFVDDDYSWFTPDWALVGPAEMPRRPTGANALSISVRAAVDPGASTKISSPVAYSSELLSRVLENKHDRSIISPMILPTIPCATLPSVALGVGEPAARVVDNMGNNWMLPAVWSPFAGLVDLDETVRYPLDGFDSISVIEFLRDDQADAVLPAVLQR